MIMDVRATNFTNHFVDVNFALYALLIVAEGAVEFCYGRRREEKDDERVNEGDIASFL